MNHEYILIIDHQEYWRDFSKQALQSAGFNVLAYDTSTYLNGQNEHSQLSQEILTFPFEAAQKYKEKQKPDLIIIGCAQVGEEEQALIEQFLGAKYHLLVVSTFLSRQVMRSLFLQGVDDVANKPYIASNLVAMVQDTLQSILVRNL